MKLGRKEKKSSTIRAVGWRCSINQRATFAATAIIAALSFGARADAFDTSFETARSVDRDSGFHFVVRAGLTAGGDTISSYTLSNGMEREITAGGLEQIGLGTRYQFGDLPLSLEFGINYQLDHDYNENDKASFRRVPLEGIFYINLPSNFRIGGGARHVYSATATSTIGGISERIGFRNTRGSIVEIGYHVTPYGWVALRYVREDYLVESYSSTSTTAQPVPVGTIYDGAHIGAFLVFEN